MSFLRLILRGLIVLAASSLIDAAEPTGRWVGSWTSMPQQVEPQNMAPAPGVADNTLRQIIQPSLDGSRLRLTFSNAFGDGPVTIAGVHVARSRGGFEINAASEHAVTFNGGPSVTIPAGALMISDVVETEVVAMENLAVTTEFGAVPKNVTGHPGSRTTSYLKTGHAAEGAAWTDAVQTDHWYYLSAVDVEAVEEASPIVPAIPIRGRNKNGTPKAPTPAPSVLIT